MAGWSILTDGSALDYFEILRNLQNNGFCLDLDAASLKVGDGGKDNKLRCLFDHILSVFLKEISLSEDIRPLPAMLGDGQCVDLFKLFCVVRVKGGYDAVSKYGLWASVAEESGLSAVAVSSVKLFYIKYLDTFDRWVRTIFREKSLGRDLGLADCGGNLSLLPVELETEFKGFLCDMPDQMKIVDQPNQSDLKTNGFGVSAVGNTIEVASSTESGCGKKCVDDDEDVMILDPSEVNQDMYSRKRKRESLFGMLNWVTEIAKNPGDSGIRSFVEASKQKADEGQDFRVLAVFARNALIQKRDVYSSTESSLLQKKQKMHPSMYDDETGVDHQSMERLRYSSRLFAQKSSHFHSSSESSDLDMNLNPLIVGTVNHQSFVIADSVCANMVVDPFDDDQFRKRVPIGPLFQAEVPEWTGMSSESDSKWLGTQQWPLVTGENNSLIERDSIGKGRPDSCGCRLPGSVECIRFHIAEEKMRLKLELGLAFYNWRLHRMGEEVSLSWTEDEEKRFKAVVRLNPPSLGKSFWNQAFRCFPSKNRKSLVSYYFNVFVLRRRSYQNRVIPNNIDSDDDESEFGSVSNGFGHEAVKVSDSRSIVCAQNNQCIELD